MEDIFGNVHTSIKLVDQLPQELVISSEDEKTIKFIKSNVTIAVNLKNVSLCSDYGLYKKIINSDSDDVFENLEIKETSSQIIVGTIDIPRSNTSHYSMRDGVVQVLNGRFRLTITKTKDGLDNYIGLLSPDNYLFNRSTIELLAPETMFNQMKSDVLTFGPIDTLVEIKLFAYCVSNYTSAFSLEDVSCVFEDETPVGLAGIIFVPKEVPVDQVKDENVAELYKPLFDLQLANNKLLGKVVQGVWSLVGMVAVVAVKFFY